MKVVAAVDRMYSTTRSAWYTLGRDRLAGCLSCTHSALKGQSVFSSGLRFELLKCDSKDIMNVCVATMEGLKLLV